jgi:hypothetical protein
MAIGITERSDAYYAESRAQRGFPQQPKVA